MLAHWLLSSALAFCQSPANSADAGRLYGLVVGRGATITLKLLPNGKTVATSQTNRKGAFDFRAVTPGRYLVAIQAPGYSLQRFGVIVEPGKDVDLEHVVMHRDLPCPSPSPPSSTAHPDRPIRTTLCEIMKQPDRFNGKLVQFRATVRYGFEASLLSDGKNDVWLDYAGLVVTMTVPGGVKPPSQPIVLVKDAEFERMTHYLWARSIEPDGSMCDRCFLYKDVTVNAVGLFEHVDSLTMGFGMQQRGIGFGHMNMYESRLILQSVSHVVATPIDPSIYGKDK
jgi:hypothetical protein